MNFSLMNLDLPDFSFLYEYGGMSVELIIWSLFIGIAIASASVIYIKQVLGSFVRILLEKKAFSPESAVSLEEAGFAKNIFVKNSLRKKGTLRKTIFSEDEKRFYIPEEKAPRAEYVYNKKGNGVVGIIITIFLFAVVAFLCAMIVPKMLELLNGIFGGA